MPLFRNECLRDTRFSAHDLAFQRPVFELRYGRHVAPTPVRFTRATAPWSEPTEPVPANEDPQDAGYPPSDIQ